MNMGSSFLQSKAKLACENKEIGWVEERKKKTTAKDVDTGYRKCTKIVSIEGGESC